MRIANNKMVSSCCFRYFVQFFAFAWDASGMRRGGHWSVCSRSTRARTFNSIFTFVNVCPSSSINSVLFKLQYVFAFGKPMNFKKKKKQQERMKRKFSTLIVELWLALMGKKKNIRNPFDCFGLRIRMLEKKQARHKTL